MKVFILFKLKYNKDRTIPAWWITKSKRLTNMEEKNDYVVEGLYTTLKGAARRSMKLHSHLCRKLPESIYCYKSWESDVQSTYIIEKPLKGLIRKN